MFHNMTENIHLDLEKEERRLIVSNDHCNETVLDYILLSAVFSAIENELHGNKTISVKKRVLTTLDSNSLKFLLANGCFLAQS